MRKGKLQINLLGRPEVWLDDKSLTSFSTAKTEALLYYLATTRQAHSRETLAGLLWGEMPEAKARRNLTKSLTVLRRLLGPFLLIEPQQVGFDPDMAFELDISRFETAISSSNLSPEAAALYRGDFLDGFFVKGALAFEEWLLTQRERFREMALGALESLAARSAGEKDFSTGIAYTRRLLALDPWRESAHRQVMLLLARQGQHAAALAQYEQCRRVLAEELGVEPMPETIALFRRIRAMRTKASFLLPHSTAPLVGRERELEKIQQLLQDPSCRLLTITGLGGIGKSRLAIDAAHRINRESALLFLNGVAFISLAGVAAGAAVPLALANALDVPLSGAVSPRRALLNFLRNREMLLVLDNFEHLTEAVELLSELLQTCPDVKLLVTSRKALNMASEWRLDLEGLPVPPKEESDAVVLQTYAAVELFARSASQVDTQFRLSEENAAAVRQLCRLVGGIPLALQLAAAWLRVMSIRSILAALERDLDILATEMRDIPSRQRSMRAVFDSTWQHLAAEEQQALETMSVCRGGFTQKAAEAIAAASPFHLARLVDRALVHQQGESRFDMHPLTRQYAQEKLVSAGRDIVAAAKHSQFYLSWLASQESALRGMTPQTAIDAIKEDLENVQQAWELAARSKQTELLLHSNPALTTFFDLLGLMQDGEALVNRAISNLGEASGFDEELLLCRLRIAKGRFISTQGKYDPAEETLESAMELAQRLGHEESVADIHHILGRILTDTGKYAEAKQHYWQALTTYRQLSKDHQKAEALANLGWTHIVEDHVDEAVPILREALVLERKTAHKRGEAYVLGNLAVAYAIQGELQKALANQETVLTAYEDLGDMLNIERAENNLGMTLLNMGRYSAALPHMERAVELGRQVGALPELANALDSLGTARLACGHYIQAKACLDEALNSALEIGYIYMNYSVRAVLAKLFIHTGDSARAQQQLQELHSLAERLENAAYMARSLAEQAQLAYLQGDLLGATDLVAQAITILRNDRSPLDMPLFLLQQARYLREQGLRAEALPLVEEALEVAHKLRHEPLQMQSCTLAALLSVRLGEATIARTHEEAATSLLAQLEPYPDVLEGLMDLGRYRLAIGNSRASLRIGTFVWNHPASAYTVRRHAEELLEEISRASPDRLTSRDPRDWGALVRYLVGKKLPNES